MNTDKPVPGLFGAGVSKIEETDFPALVRHITHADEARFTGELALAAALIKAGADTGFDLEGRRRSQQRASIVKLLESIVDHGDLTPPEVREYAGWLAVRTLAQLEDLGYGEACVYALTRALLPPDVYTSHAVRGTLLERDGIPCVLFDRYVFKPNGPSGPDPVRFLQSPAGWEWTLEPIDHRQEADLASVRTGDVKWKPLDVGSRPTVPAFVDATLPLVVGFPRTSAERAVQA
jgi:hypothetical protein